jgi:hypothetical protein
MVNKHFTDESLLSFSVDRGSIDATCACLDTFFPALVVVVNDHKIKFCLVGLDSMPNWILISWTKIFLGTIVWYLGIPFGLGLSQVSMWY